VVEISFPAYGTTWPSLTAWQASFSGYTFGQGTALELREIQGIDMPTVRTGDAGRPRDHGMFRGLDVMGERELILDGDLHNKSGSFEEAEAALAAATVPGGSEDTPLFQALPGWGTLAAMARVRKRQMPRDITVSLGNLGKVALMFAADDPRWYAQTQQTTVSPPTKSAGFSFPMSFPLSFGGGSSAGVASVTNAGNIETRPLLIIEGPCENPSITNATAEGSPNLRFNMVVAAGGRLVLDTDFHTATYYTAGTTLGSTRLGTLAYGSRWFTLAPGTSTLQFLSATSEGRLSIQWASAYVL
jgi:hypothetical protein